MDAIIILFIGTQETKRQHEKPTIESKKLTRNLVLLLMIALFVFPLSLQFVFREQKKTIEAVNSKYFLPRTANDNGTCC